MKLLRRLELFNRLPKFRPLSSELQEIIPLDVRNNYPGFASDFDTLQKEVIPYFRELDNEAFRSQNAYRWTYIILILGGALATILGIVQLAFINTAGIGIAGAVVAAILAAATAFSQSFNQHDRYLNSRLAAERLRCEYFLFLGHLGRYANDQLRVQKLLQRVTEIRKEAEGSGSAK